MEKLRPIEEMWLRILQMQSSSLACCRFLNVTYEEIKAWGVRWWWRKVPQLWGGDKNPALRSLSRAALQLWSTSSPCTLSRFPWQPCRTNHPLWVAMTHSIYRAFCFFFKGKYICIHCSLSPNGLVHGRKRLGHLPENRYPGRKWKAWLAETLRSLWIW